MKRLLALILTITVCFGLLSCNKSAESAVDQLTENDYELYSVIKNKLSDFKNPASVTIISAAKTKNNLAVVDVSALNGYGGNSSEEYLIALEDLYVGDALIMSKGGMKEPSTVLTCIGSISSIDKEAKVQFSNDLVEMESCYDVSALNAALKEYKMDQGWID